jgi:hypothetical protein
VDGGCCLRFRRERPWLLLRRFRDGKRAGREHHQHIIDGPWIGQQPFLIGGTDGTGNPAKGTFNEASNLYQNYTPSYFGPSTVSDFTPNQTAGINQEANLGATGASSVNAANQNLTNTANGDYLSAGNPYFQSMADQIKAQVTPQIESQFAAGNRMGSPGSGYAVGNGLGTAIGNLAFQNYANERNNQTQASALAPANQSAQYQNVAALTDAGAQQQTQNQAQLNDQIARFNFQQQLPYNKLGIYNSMINGQYGGTSTTSQPFFSNSVGSGLGAASSAVGLYQQLFSDPRSKTVKGKHTKALEAIEAMPVSEAHYLWEDATAARPMVMSTDVQKVAPYAVEGDVGATDVTGSPIYQTVDHRQLVPLLIGAVQELAAEVRALKSSGRSALDFLTARLPVEFVTATLVEPDHAPVGL